MDNRNSFIMGALVAMVGMAIGASSAGGSTVAFGAFDPNRAHEGFRPVGQESALRTKRAVVRDRYANRPVSTFQDPTVHGRPIYSAAPESAEASEPDMSRCEGLTGSRLNRCAIGVLEGMEYQIRETPGLEE